MKKFIVCSVIFISVVVGISFFAGDNNLPNSIGLGVIAWVLLLVTFIRRPKKKGESS